MRRYVVGFSFWRNKVLLLHKKKGPAYVIGKLNGVGGKIESEEATEVSMAREYAEETGVETWPSQWEHVATMFGPDYELNILYTYMSDVTDFSQIKNPEDKGEDLEWILVDELEKHATVENLKWIIPLCLDRTTPFLRIYED